MKQLSLLNFVKPKTIVKKVKIATPDDTETSSSHSTALTELQAELKLSEAQWKVSLVTVVLMMIYILLWWKHREALTHVVHLL